MNKKLFTSIFLVMVSALVVSACSSSSSSNDSSSGSTTPPTGSGVGGGSGTWEVSAAVSQDGCHERISPVNQTFVLEQQGGQEVVDTGLASASGPTSGGGFTVSYSSSGACSRTFTIEFADASGSTSPVTLKKRSDCGGVVCENIWTGTAVRQG